MTMKTSRSKQLKKEVATTSGNSRRRFKLIREAGGRRTSIVEMVCDKMRRLLMVDSKRSQLASVGGINSRKQQAGIRPRQDSIDQIFTLDQLLEVRHTYCRTLMLVFLDVKGIFNSVDWTVLFGSPHRKSTPEKLANLFGTLYSHTCSRVRVRSQLSSSFETISGVQNGCPIFPLFFNFLSDKIMVNVFGGLQNVGVGLANDERLWRKLSRLPCVFAPMYGT